MDFLYFDILWYSMLYVLQPSDDSDMMKRDEGVDTFTLLHHDLNVCTNHVSPGYIPTLLWHL